MKNTLIFLLLFISKVGFGQIPIDWPICVEQTVYNYTNEKLEDYILKHKFIKFCYSHNYFGLNKNGYLEIFPLEAYSTGVNESGYITESFINGTCPNYNRGDLYIIITHGKPQSILINYTVINPWSVYIQTNSLYSGKISKLKDVEYIKPTKVYFPNDSVFAPYDIDSFVSNYTQWGNGRTKTNGSLITAYLKISVNNLGRVKIDKFDGIGYTDYLLNAKYNNAKKIESELKLIFSKMPKWENRTHNKILYGEYNVEINTISKKEKKESEKHLYTDNDPSKMCMVRITEPLNLDIVGQEISVDKNLLNKWNSDYDLFIHSTYPTPFYNLRIPKEKLDIYLQKKDAITKRSRIFYEQGKDK